MYIGKHLPPGSYSLRSLICLIWSPQNPRDTAICHLMQIICIHLYLPSKLSALGGQVAWLLEHLILWTLALCPVVVACH
jgi:hypothetical protein